MKNVYNLVTLIDKISKLNLVELACCIHRGYKQSFVVLQIFPVVLGSL